MKNFLRISLVITISCFFITANDNDTMKKKLKQECDSGNGESCKKLYQILKNEHWSLRLPVVVKITDEAFLIKIVKNKKENDNVRCAAVRNQNLKDKKILFKIANSRKYYTGICCSAVENPNLHEIKLLTQIVKNHKQHYLVRCEAVDQIQDQNILTDIAENDPNWRVKGKAVIKLTDANILKSFAQRSDKSLRMGAAQNPYLIDIDLLAKMAKTDPDRQVRIAAIGNPNIRDQELFRQIAKNDDRSSVRVAAVERINDPKLLAEIAKTNPDKYVRKAAVLNPLLLDYELFADIAKNDKDINVRKAAEIAAIKDEVAIAQIAIKDMNFMYRIMAIQRLKDQAIIQEIAKNTSEANSVREVAISKVTDIELLEYLIKNDKDEYVLNAAKKQLSKIKNN